MAKQEWLQKALKKQKKKSRKIKSKELKVRRDYVKGMGAEFPIYVFLDGKKELKIKSMEHLNKKGLHLGTVLTAVRDGTKYRGRLFSYNKSIQ